MLNNIGLPGLILIGVAIYTILRLTGFRFGFWERYNHRSKSKTPWLATPKSNQGTTTDTAPIVGKCHVIDGDTIHIGKKKIRFAGINAPELDEPYGKQAKWAMVELCKGQQITAYPTGETSYNRIVAKCFLHDGRDLAAEIVKQELALDLPHFPDPDYKHFETPAARKKLNWKPSTKKKPLEPVINMRR